jgi:predicted nucleic acid-binding protein
VGLMDDLGVGPVGLDTVAFIYWIEEDARFLPLLEPLFAAIDRGERSAATSALTLLEVSVVPLRSGNLPLAERYEALLTRSRGLEVIELDRRVLRAAARLRAAYHGLRTPDALQLSSALVAGCSSFVTNDRALPDLPGLRVLQLGSYAGP